MTNLGYLWQQHTGKPVCFTNLFIEFSRNIRIMITQTLRDPIHLIHVLYFQIVQTQLNSVE